MFKIFLPFFFLRIVATQILQGLPKLWKPHAMCQTLLNNAMLALSCHMGTIEPLGNRRLRLMQSLQAWTQLAASHGSWPKCKAEVYPPSIIS